MVYRLQAGAVAELALLLDNDTQSYGMIAVGAEPVAMFAAQSSRVGTACSNFTETVYSTGFNVLLDPSDVVPVTKPDQQLFTPLLQVVPQP
jgi:hypothetical protein